MLYVAFERGDLPSLALEYYGSVYSNVVVRGVFLAEKEGKMGAMYEKKGAIRPKGPRRTGRIITLLNLILGGYGIAMEASLRVAQKPITERQRAEKNVVRSASCAGKGALQGKGVEQLPPPSLRRAD